MIRWRRDVEAALAAAGLAPEPTDDTGGNHLAFWVTDGATRAKVFLPQTPGDVHRALRNAVTAARKAIRFAREARLKRQEVIR